MSYVKKTTLFYAFCVRGYVASHVASDPRGTVKESSRFLPFLPNFSSFPDFSLFSSFFPLSQFLANFSLSWGTLPPSATVHTATDL